MAVHILDFPSATAALCSNIHSYRVESCTYANFKALTSLVSNSRLQNDT